MRMKTYWRNLFVAVGMTIGVHAQAQHADQASGGILTPKLNLGISLSGDWNKQVMTTSLALEGKIGIPSDFLNVSVGLGYRGFWDMNPSLDFCEAYPKSATVWNYIGAVIAIVTIFATDEKPEKDEKQKKEDVDRGLRPLGGEMIIPVNLHVNFLKLNEKKELMMYAGIGSEFGVTIYQSKRYKEFYGSKFLGPVSLAVAPMIGIGNKKFEASVYWNHYVVNWFDRKAVPEMAYEQKDHWGVKFAFFFRQF